MFRRFIALVAAMALAWPMAAQAQAWGAHGRGGDAPSGRGGYGERGYGGGERGYGGFGGERGFGDGRGRPGPAWRQPQGDRGPGPGAPPPPAGRRGGPGYGGPGYGGAGRRGWARGEYMPPQARGQMVQDFARYHLRRPPRGYFWYRSGDNFVLTSAATGVVFEVIPADPY